VVRLSESGGWLDQVVEPVAALFYWGDWGGIVSLTAKEIAGLADVLTRLETKNPNIITDRDGKRWIIVRADKLPVGSK